MNVKRGDVLRVEFDGTRGSEQHGTRPAVVVQNDVGNRHAPTTIVAPVTSQYDPAKVEPYQAELRADSTPVDGNGVACCQQLRTVSIAQRVDERYGRLDPGGQAIEAVDRALAVSVELPFSRNRRY